MFEWLTDPFKFFPVTTCKVCQTELNNQFKDKYGYRHTPVKHTCHICDREWNTCDDSRKDEMVCESCLPHTTLCPWCNAHIVPQAVTCKGIPSFRCINCNFVWNVPNAGIWEEQFDWIQSMEERLQR